MLGVYVTDGCISDTNIIDLSSKDEEWVDNIRRITCPNAKLRKERNCFRFEYTSHIIGKWLINHGCVPRKSLTLEVKNIPDEHIKDFIRGVICGDGSLIIYNKKGTNKKCFSITIGTGSEIFAKQLVELYKKF